jgi:hypothetical protein
MFCWSSGSVCNEQIKEQSFEGFERQPTIYTRRLVARRGSFRVSVHRTLQGQQQLYPYHI